MHTFKEEKLTPCPFCGCKVHTKTNGLTDLEETQVWRVQCKRCGANSGEHHTEEAAVKAWEQRVQYLEVCENNGGEK